MKILVTGGTGFIGRWVVKRLLKDGHKLWIIDNLSNSKIDNIEEFIYHENLEKVLIEDLKDREFLKKLCHDVQFDICYHLAASINDTMGTFYLLEECRAHKIKMVFMSTCMVYDKAKSDKGITESDSIKPASPYAGAKIAAENMVLSYYFAYKLPVVVLRPFNTFGPFQKSNGEGGVVAIFINNKLKGQSISIYGDGTQTRDLLYVEDCADFVVETGYSEKANGKIIHAGSGNDITINELASYISENKVQINHVPHIHPQSEIAKLLCNYKKAEDLLSWKPKVSLEEGIERTENWIKSIISRQKES